MFTLKRTDTGKYLTTESKWGAQEWSYDLINAHLFKRKSTAERRAEEFNDLDNFTRDIPCKVVQIGFFEKGL